MAVTGVNLRNTLAHATDGVGFTACTGTNRTYSAAQGFGWTSGPQSQRDRTYTQGTPYATQFAGMHFSQNSGQTFRLDLPNGAGTYKVYAIHADLGYNNNTGYRYKDGSTVIASVSGGTTSHGSGATYRDILDNSRSPVTDFDLPNENYVLRTFTNDHLLVERDTSLVTGHGVLSSVWVEPATLPTGLGDEKIWLCPSLDDSADDLSGNGNNGTYNGSIGTVSDTTSGGVRAYDGTTGTGTSDYVSVTWPNSNLTTRSMSVWIQPIGFGQYTNRQPISGPIKFANPGNTVAFRNQLNSYPWDANYPVASSANAHNSQWHCYTIVQDSSNTSVYVDGVFYANYTTNSNTNYGSGNGVFQIAREASYIDDFRVYERKLTQTEITHLATSRGVQGNPYDYNGLGDEKLWLCPSLDDSADDISGNGNHGTYQGNATTAADTSNGGVKAYYFATGGDCITHDQFGGPLSESQTVTWWSKHNSTGSRVHQVSCTVHEPDGYIGGSNNRWTYEVFNNTTERFWPNGSGSNYNVTRSTANTWRHNCWVRDDGSGDSLFYVDGVLDTTVSQPSIYDANTNISNLLVGLAAGNPTVDLYIDDVRTYGRALTTSEITALASERGYEVPQPAPHPLTISIKHPLG